MALRLINKIKSSKNAEGISQLFWKIQIKKTNICLYLFVCSSDLGTTHFSLRMTLWAMSEKVGSLFIFQTSCKSWLLEQINNALLAEITNLHKASVIRLENWAQSEQSLSFVCSNKECVCE